MKLSIALATYNEEHFLFRCLESIADIADEIVIVDGGSSDTTKKIAKEYGAKIYDFDNPAIFHINKQRAIDRCHGQWILQLDADEVVSSELKKEILYTIGQKNDINGYFIPRKNYFLGRFLIKGGQYPDYTMRLYRRGKGKLPCKSVHEQAEIIGKTKYLKNDLLHYADEQFDRYLLRFNRYTNLMRDELYEAKAPRNIQNFISYIFVKPIRWFLLTFVRHKGFVDGWQGFVFSFFSSLRFAVAYWKYLNV